MKGLTLSLLGPFSAYLNGRPLHKFRTNRVQALLVFLATEAALGSRRHRREALMELLWPGLPRKSAQINLRQCLYSLRKAVPVLTGTTTDSATPFLITDRQNVEINAAYPLELDVDQFTELMRNSQTLENAVKLYRGDFLADFYLPDSAAFEDWVSMRRAAFLRMVLDALANLTETKTAQKEYQAAESYARRQLELDALRESAYRQLMIALAISGKRSEALAVSSQCQEILQIDLSVSPSAETVALREAIASGQLDKVYTGKGASSFEPLQTDLSPSSNLPIQTTPLIGRQAELTALDKYFADRETRLVTIVGPGGIGKTRLAVAAAKRQLPTLAADDVGPTSDSGKSPASSASLFANGVFFVSLAPLNAAEHIVTAIAEAISFQLETGERQTRPPRQQLLDYLDSKRMLLVMDNFEHLLDGIDLLVDILQAAPGVQILVTSRERLYVQHEQLFPLKGLDFPDGETDAGTRATRDDLDYPAIELFLLAARRIQPNFELTAADVPPLNLLCRLVDGMPLAIELAASWVSVLSLADIAAEIQQSLDFLTTDARTVDPRHRSIRAVFDACWRRLAEDESQAFKKLSVFRGGFSRLAAEAVTGASLRLLAALAGKSLLTFEKNQQRYHIHELLRQFGARLLAEMPPEERQARQLHSAYYCRWLHNFEDDLRGARRSQAAGQITTELENIRVAWDWAVRQENSSELALAMDSLGHFHQQQGNYLEGDRLFKAAIGSLDEPRKLDSDPRQPPRAASENASLEAKIRARLLAWRGSYQALLGQGERAQRLLQESLDLLDSPWLRQADVRPELAFALYQTGALKRHSDIAAADKLLRRSLTISRELGDLWLESRCVRQLGIIAQASGDYEESLRFYRHSLAMRQQLGDREGSAQAYYELAFDASFRGAFEEGERLFLECHAILSQSKESASIAKGLDALGFGSFWMGKFELSKTSWQQFAAINEELGARLPLARALTFLSMAMRHLGEYEQAYATALKGLELNEQIGSAAMARTSHSLTFAAAAASGVGDYKEAARLGEKASKGYEMVGHRQRLGEIRSIRAHAHYGLGDISAARQLALETLKNSNEVQNSYGALNALPLVALLLAEEGQLNRAMRIRSMAWKIPFIANSRWLYDAAGRKLETLVANLSPDELAAAQAEGESLDLWGAVTELLEVLPSLGWAANE